MSIKSDDLICSIGETVPTAQQLKEAYALAREVQDLEPWKRMEERQVLAVHFADGRQGFFSVTGTEGQHRAIALYPSFAAYCNILACDEQDPESVMDRFFATDQLQLAFESTQNLKPGEAAAIKASGIAFKRGQRPSFVSYIAGYIDDRMGAAELTRYTDFLKAFLAFYKLHGPDAIAVKDSHGKLLTTWTEQPSGEWVKDRDEYSHMLPIEVDISDALIDQVAAMPVIDKRMFLEFAAYPIPMGRAPNGRGKLSRLVVAVEGATQFCLGAKLIETPDDRELDWTPIVDFALRTMLKFGKRPTDLAAFGCGLYGTLKVLAATRFKGTTFLPYSRCDSARQVFEDLQSELQTRQGRKH